MCVTLFLSIDQEKRSRMVRFLKFMGRGVGSVGKFLGFGGMLTYLLQGYTQFRVFKEIGNFFGSAKNVMGAHFHKFAESNPFINFFFVSGIIVFCSSLLISFFYKIFGLKMHKKLQGYILISPFLIIFCGIIYVGYIHNLRTKDAVYSNFSGARTEGEVASVKTQKGYTHKAQKSYEKEYIFNSIGKNLSEAFYADMCRELSYDELNERVFKKIKVKGYYTGRSYNLNITPLMYAAYIGNEAAVAALLKSGKANIRAVVVTRDKLNCPDGAGWALGEKYTYKSTHTPFSIAHDNGHGVKTLIRDASKKAGYDEYKGYYSNNKNDRCHAFWD